MEEIMKKMSIQVLLIINSLLYCILGEYDGAFYTLVVFVVIDYVTSIICAIINRELARVVSAKHLLISKASLFIIVGMGNILDKYVFASYDGALRIVIIFFYISNEGLSILENLSVIGLPIPNKLKDTLNLLHKDEHDNKK